MARWQDEYLHERRERRLVGGAERPNLPAPARDTRLDNAMRDYLESRYLDYHVAVRAGWYPAVFYGSRIIIPCVRTDGGIWWQARLIELPHRVITASEVLGLQKRWQGCHGYRGDAVCFIPGDPNLQTVIVEGPMDALAAAGLGYPAIAILGAQPPKIIYDHVAKLVVYSYLKGKALVIPDMDRIACWQETQHELGLRGVNGKLIIVPGCFKDLAECPEELRKEILDEI